MSKKKKEKKSAEPELPKFGGFHPLEGLRAFKEKLKEEEEAKKKDEAQAKKPPPRPAPPPKSAPHAQPEGDEELSFHRMMAGVTPLADRSARVPKTGDATAAKRIDPSELREKAKAEAAEALEHLHRLVDETARFEVVDDGKRVEGRRTDVAPALVRDLRHGRLPIDARLDLHGLPPAEARERVLQFLREMRMRRERVVLVIHGKGEGVLRGEVATWLSQGRAREHVAAFATATERDGGEGALYVALRR